MLKLIIEGHSRSEARNSGRVVIDKINFNKIDIANNQRKTNYADDRLEYVPDEYKKVAKGMETQFLEFMIGQMKKTVDHAEEPSSARNYYESLVTHERAKTMSERNDGKGIKKLILDQIYPRKFRNKHAFQAYTQRQNANKVITHKREDIGMGKPEAKD